MCGVNSVLCFDEISTGLDSAATYDITKAINMHARKFELIAIISLLQPPPEVVTEFDEVSYY